MPDPASANAPALPPFSIEQCDLQDGTAVVSVSGELDLFTAPQLRWALTGLAEWGRHRVVVDLTGVDFMDSTAVSVLIAAQTHAHPASMMVIACDRPSIMWIFETTGLDRGFVIVSTVDEAAALIDAAASELVPDGHPPRWW